MERRLTVILAADVVGYSRLMEADEDSTIKILNDKKKIISDIVRFFNGREFGTAGPCHSCADGNPDIGGTNMHHFYLR